MSSLLANPPSVRLIVCEGGGSWSIALRLELAAAGVRIWDCRSLPEAWDALGQTPAAFLVAEATGENLDALLPRMAWLSRDFPQARIAVVADRGMARYEWLLREAGAVHFLTSPRKLAQLAAVVVRHLANVPPPLQSLVDRVWASLPWGPPGK
jgi:hypothetical protein